MKIGEKCGQTSIYKREGEGESCWNLNHERSSS